MTKEEYDIQMALGSLSLQDRLVLACSTSTNEDVLVALQKDVNVHVRVNAGLSLCWVVSVNKLEQKVQS